MIFHGQAIREWGTVLSPSFSLNPESFLLASLLSGTEVISLNGYVGSPVVIPIQTIEHFAGKENAKKGIDLLVNKELVYIEGNNIVLGTTVSMFKNTYLFQENKQAQPEENPEETTLIYKPATKNPVVHTTLDFSPYFKNYQRFCNAINKPNQYKSHLLKVEQIYTKTVKESFISSHDYCTYFSILTTVINEYSTTKTNNFTGKEYGLAANLIKTLGAETLVEITPYFIANIDSIRKNTPANMQTLAFYKDVTLKRYNEHKKHRVQSGSPEQDDLA